MSLLKRQRTAVAEQQVIRWEFFYSTKGPANIEFMGKSGFTNELLGNDFLLKH